MLEKHHHAEEHREWLAGVIASAVANFSLGAPKEPVRPSQFALPRLKHLEPRPKRKTRKRIAQERERITAGINAFFVKA